MSQEKPTHLVMFAVATALVCAAIWMSLGTPEADTPAPIEIEDLRPAAPAPTPTPAPVQPASTRSPRVVAEDAFQPMGDGVSVAVLAPGRGTPVTPGHTVTVRYARWSTGGPLLDSSPETIGVQRLKYGQGSQGTLFDDLIARLLPGGSLQARVAAGTPGMFPAPPAGEGLVIDLDLVSVSEPRVAPDAPSERPEATFQQGQDGLVYSILSAGTGEKPASDDTVTFDFTIWLPDGTRLDSSLLRGRPQRLKLGNHATLAGIEQSLLDMAVGESRQARLPPALGFGARGKPGVVAPDTPLTVELTLRTIEPR